MSQQQQRPAKTGSKFLRRLVSCVIIFAAIILGWPQPTLDWNDVLNLVGNRFHAATSSDLPMEGTVVVISGSTSGLGLGLTRTLHRLGATVIALGRSPTKLSNLKQELGDNLVTVLADFSNLDSIAQAADEISSKYDEIHVLINNAGMHYSTSMMDIRSTQATAQGYDQVFGVNYLSHFLLTEKFLPLLHNGRIVQISSSFHMLADGSDLSGSPPRASLNLSNFFHKERSYSNSKFAQILHARSLNKHHNNVTAVSVCPGWVGTNIAGGGISGWILKHLAFNSEGWGVASTLHAMSSSSDKYDYFSNSRFSDTMSRLVTPLFVGRSWTVSTGLRDAVVWICAMALLLFQRFDPPVTAGPSSPETYDKDLQETLYQWSKEAVSPWL